jgi:hypothetical protein
MADVRMPDGTIIRNVPAGITKSELQARVAKMGGGPSMVPAPEGLDIAGMARREVAQLADSVQGEGGFLERMNARFQPGELAPLLGMGAAAMVPGAGWASLLAGSGLAGGVTALGDMAKQNVRGDVNVTQALKAGATEGAANLAGGTALKALGATSRALFHTELDDAAKAGAKFAREQGAPFPLSSAAPASRAGRIQQGSRSLLPGDIRTQVDANKVTTFLNNQVAKITDNASPLDEAATKGQQFLRQVFEPGETVYTQTFKNLRNTVGDETPIPITKARQVMEGAAEALKKRGEMKSVYNRLQNVLKGKATELTAAQVDELYSGLLKDAARNANARREVNAVLSAIAEDADVVGKGFGINFGDDLAKAKAVRDQYRELRNIPGLERLGKDFGEKGGTLGTRQWMSELFANPNGKALAELRTRNPQLYHELADSWLASNLNRFSRPVKEGFGRALDGSAFRAWYEQNAPALKVVLGGKQAQALDNFSLYAKHMTGAVERSVQGSRGMDPMAMLARGGAEGAAVVKQPWLMIPGEAASYVLAKGLSDPSSMLFKAFTEGFSPATRSFVIKSGQLGAQAASKQNGQNAR